MALGLLKDTQTQVIFQQTPGELASVRGLLGLNEVEAEAISSLHTGTALWQVNGRSFLVRHELTQEERCIVDTDQRMTPTPREFRDSEGSTGGNSRVVGRD